MPPTAAHLGEVQEDPGMHATKLAYYMHKMLIPMVMIDFFSVAHAVAFSLLLQC